MTSVTGFIEKIKYRNEENGYSVLEVSSDGTEYVLVGIFHSVSEGELIEVAGTMTEHPVYGEQLAVESYKVKTPEDAAAMERYLGSGAIKGVGAALAARIVRRFQADTFRVMEEEPERLAEVKGISERMALAISRQMEEKRDAREAMIFLQGYGISMNLAMKIYKEYGPRVYGIIRENPYRLAEDIPGVGFKMADEIAAKAGVLADSDYRIKAGLLYTLLQAAGQGHTYLPKSLLLSRTSELLQTGTDTMERLLTDMQMEKRIIIRRVSGVQGREPVPERDTARERDHAAGAGEAVPAQDPDPAVYAAPYYYMELNTARMLHDLNFHVSVPEEEIRKRLLKIREQTGLQPDPLQADAVKEAACSGLLIITGGPGTGKTTTINAIIRYFEMEQMEILLAAPTGRAAKRMTEATGYEAKTIHRLLELNGAPREDGSVPMRFERNEENPLEADVIIIDEMSMVDIQLMQSLLRAVNAGTRLILAGDVNQLPSVGPGNVLRDIIHSGCFHVVMLTRIFRQAAESDIIVNAHRINRGEKVDLTKRSRDFLFIRRENPDAIISAMITLLTRKLPAYVHARPRDIQILTPMRKGPLGVERLNSIFQSCLNPPAHDKPEKETGGVIFRLGDKVMQIRNNYQIAWEVRGPYGTTEDTGTGVFNGDIGTIREINLSAETLTVEFDERRMVEYEFSQLEDLELAYAVTIHKSQGSEYPAVIIPVFGGPRMLMTRNLIYTAVTRARLCVCLVGLPEAFQAMADNRMEQKRYSGLKDRILEIPCRPRGACGSAGNHDSGGMEAQGSRE